MSIVEELKKKEQKPKVLGLPEKIALPNKVFKADMLYNKFGIENETSKYIREKKKEKEKVAKQYEKEFANNELLKNIIPAFGVYKLVSYKTMDEIAKKYNLYMTGLDKYNKPIPVENLEELDAFTGKFGDIVTKLDGRLFADRNDKFIFKLSRTYSYDLPKIQNLGFDALFYVMAPKSHLKIQESDIIVGREIQDAGIKKPKFKYTPTINLPEPKDPIIFLPFKVAQTTHCAIITAWDKVADDIELRKMI